MRRHHAAIAERRTTWRVGAISGMRSAISAVKWGIFEVRASELNVKVEEIATISPAEKIQTNEATATATPTETAEATAAISVRRYQAVDQEQKLTAFDLQMIMIIRLIHFQI